MVKNAILLCIILFGNNAFSNSIVSPDSLDTETVLFRVTHVNNDNVSYLFGTHHALGKQFFDSLNFASEALLSSDILLKENLNLPGHLAEDIINKRNITTNWKKYLNEEDHSYVLNLFSSSKLEFDKMTPAELSAFLSRHYKEKICVGKVPSPNYASLDDYIGFLAKENQVAVIGLETTEEQIQLINEDIKGMPRKVHKMRLERMVARTKSESKDLCSEIDWYRDMQFDLKINQPCTNELILTNRNNKWMVKIKDYLKSNNCFIAVGFSHLMFECGLISQLQDLGYKIEPVSAK